MFCIEQNCNCSNLGDNNKKNYLYRVHYIFVHHAPELHETAKYILTTIP